MVKDNVIEGSLKFRNGKKWKLRWAVLDKLSPVADELQLHLYRDSRDKARGASTKASLALKNSLALATGFTLDKESHTLSLICKDLSIIVAFDSRERLLQWHSKISATIGHEEQFLVQLAHVPLKSRIPLGPCRIHVRDHRFSITSGIPPRLLEVWALIDLRRYGVVDGRFVWEGGTKSGRGSGVHVVLSDSAKEITRAIDLATRGALTTKHRRVSAPKPSNGTVQRDAAMWLRDVGALNICRFSEIVETTSVMASEAGSIMSPRSEFAIDRQCDFIDGSYGKCPNGSSSSGSMEDESGWYEGEWGRGRGSICEVGNLSMAESLYDSPRSFPHTLTGAYEFLHKNHLCTTRLQGVNGHRFNASPPIRIQNPYVIPNPMDNYDVPKNHAQHYDVPKNISTRIKSWNSHAMTNSVSSACSQSLGTYSCGGMFCWPGSIICKRNNFAVEATETVRVDSEGKTPVINANMGTLRPKQVICSQRKVNTIGNCKCDLSNECRKYDPNVIQQNGKIDTSISNDSPIYAVIDKSRKSSKLRAPSPHSPPILDDTTPTNPNPNYENMMFLHNNSEMRHNGVHNDHCHNCGGFVKKENENSKSDVLIQNRDFIVHSTDNSKLYNGSGETEYLVMGPRQPQPEEQSNYLVMKGRENPINPSHKPLIHRPGRSHSVAREGQYFNASIRKSTSADSILPDPFHNSQFRTPDITPYTSPLHSPTKSIPQYRTSTPCLESNRSGRGRPRKKILVGQGSLKYSFHNTNYIQDNTSVNIRNGSLGASDMSTDLFLTFKHNSHPTYDKEIENNHFLQDYSQDFSSRMIKSDYCHEDTSEEPILRRSSSVPDKSANRDSASSCDSGVYESPKPNERIFHSHCFHNSLPRGPKHKHSSPVCSRLKEGGTSSMRDIGPTSYSGDAKSSSSGTSDISDYLDTLSLSSHSSSDHERLLVRSAATTLRPRFGREYSRFDRTAIESPVLPSLCETKKIPESVETSTT